ncbi:hypothetical protein L13192_01375 [Pyrenophora tritici-repentis]|nr:hypothetical protein L13192_01375 [Pyrenophora tritici-repentis]
MTAPDSAQAPSASPSSQTMVYCRQVADDQDYHVILEPDRWALFQTDD